MRPILYLPLIILVLAGVDLPTNGPVPEDKPDQPASADSKEPVSKEAAPVAETEAPVPEEKPEAPVEKPKEKPADLPGIVAPQVDETAVKACEAELTKLGVRFKTVDPVSGENGCGIGAPYEVSEIAPGIALKPSSPMRCATALSLARWVDTVVIPSTKAFPGDVRLTQINHGSTYVCRRRNNLPTGKMSEHSIGNAVDIMSLEFEGRDPIAVSPRAGQGTIEEAYQRAIRAGACLHFTTVLGPGSDASHNNHLHLDIAKRNRDYRLCQ